MALAWLLSRWGEPSACIVDHGLRPAAAGEAARTAHRLAALGVPVRILAAGLAPGPAAGARARAARYHLLAQACRDAGCADLLVAHHAEDQAETLQIRAQAGSFPFGLAAMPAVAYTESARLVRPLLRVPSARLRGTLREAGIDWEEDPTNRDPTTPRARLRATGSVEGTRAALDEAARHGSQRRARDPTIAAELAQVEIFPEGHAIAPAPLGPAALSALIWTLSGRPYPPSLVERLESRTVHGVLVRPAGRLGAGWLLAREPAGVGPPVPARTGAVWDRRFRLAGDPPPGLEVGALGADAARFRHLSALPSVVLQTIPALRSGKEVVAVSHLGFPDASSCRNVHIWLCPARPASGAPFWASLNPGERLGGA
jgi:tRNA(Ile)-lysidine synthase